MTTPDEVKRLAGGMRHPSELICVDDLRQIVSYDPEAGALTAKVDRPPKKAGDALGWITNGYRYMRIRGKIYKANRVAWALMTGAWPECYIDHKNGNPGDDRWQNLRACDQFGNMQNVGHMKHNTSGLRGASFNRTKRKWQSYIRVNNRQVHLGYFSTASEAHAAHVTAKAQLHTFEPNLR